MSILRTFATFTLLLPVAALHAQTIIAQPAGLVNPERLIDFSGGPAPFAPITTQFAGIATNGQLYGIGSGINVNGGHLQLFDPVQITFARPIKDVSFALDLALPSPSALIIVRLFHQGVLVNNFFAQVFAAQPNNFFGFRNTIADGLQILIFGVNPLALRLDNLAFNGLPAVSREPGSLLVYPVHRSGRGFFTIVTVTNTNLVPATVAGLGGTTNAHFHYVNVDPNAANPLRPLGCSVFDIVEPLTPADTRSVLTTCHNATFGGQEGYLVVAAEDPRAFQTAWSHNYLLGSEYVVNASGLDYSIEAVAFQSGQPEGQPTDFNTNGRYDFDGIEYAQVPDKLYIDSFLALAESQLTLLNLTGQPDDINHVLLSVWNDNEVPLSATLEFNCWFDQRLQNLSGLFSSAFLAGTPNDPGELDIDCNGTDDIETGWAIVQSVGVSTSLGGFVASDGALLGAITGGTTTVIDGGRLLAQSTATQNNGSFQH